MAEKEPVPNKDNKPQKAGAAGSGTGKENCTLKMSLVSCIPIAAGLVLALILGWQVYPALLFAKKPQPVAFNHQLHLTKNNMACADCHSLRDDGSFSGIPNTAECATCHSSPKGSSEAEKNLIANYIESGLEIPWQTYQKQPANVYFSHAAHSIDSCNRCHDFAARELCNLCHINVSATEVPPVFKENRITGYSYDIMKMNHCERCHAHPKHLHEAGASNACFVCHK